MSRLSSLLCAALVVAVTPLAAQAAPVYTVSVFPNPAGSVNTVVNAINDVGGAAGYSQRTPSSPWRASAIVGGTAISLSDGSPSTENSYATDVNNNGMIVGNVTMSSGQQVAATWSNNNMTILSAGSDFHTEANAINASGQVVGFFLPAGPGPRHAFVSNGNALVDLGTLGSGSAAQSSANDINDSGAITGSTSTNAGGSHAFVYINGVMTDIGTLGGNSSSGAAINNAGVITGVSVNALGQSHAFIYADGQMIDLGTLGGTSSGLDINEAGQVVGVSAVNGQNHAFLYSNRELIDLNSLIDPALGWLLSSASDINDNGQILATGCRTGGTCGSLLLTLAQTAGPAEVPEPEAFTAGIAGLALFGLLRRRRKQA